MTDALEFLRGTEAPAPQTPPEAVEKIQKARDFLGAVPEDTATAPGVSRELSLLNVQGQGVDIESGGPAGVRAHISLASPERRSTILETAFPNGFRETDAGTVVTINQDGQLREVLLDEANLSLSDFADAAGGSVEAASALAATLAAIVVAPGAVAGGLSLAVLAVVAGVSGQVGGGTAEVIADMKAGGIDLENPEDVAMLENMVKRRSINAAVDTTLDLMSGGVLAGSGRVAQGVVGPFAREMARSPQKEIRAAADELGVTLTPGQKTGVPGLLKAEELQSKVPGSAGLVKERKRLQEDQMSAARSRLTEGAESSSAVGREVGKEVRSARASAEESVNTLNRVAETAIAREFTTLANKASRKRVSRSESGRIGRDGLILSRNNFKKKQTVLENQAQELIDALPEGRAAFAGTDVIKKTAVDLEAEFPKTTVVEKIVEGDFSSTNAMRERVGLPPLKPQTKDVEKSQVIPEFFPPAARKILSGAKKLDAKTTVDELRKARQVVANLIDDADALPGLSVGLLKKLESSFTEQIKKAVDVAPTDEIKGALTGAVNHYRENNGKYRNKIVSRALRNETQPGFIEDKDLLPGLLLKGNVEDARRIIDVLGETHPAVQTARRVVVDSILSRSRNSFTPGSFAVDPKAVQRAFDALDPEVRNLVFGADEPLAQSLIQSLGARHGLFDANKINRLPGNERIVDVLQQAAVEAESAKAIFDRKVFRPLLRGGGGSITEDQFVKHVMKTGEAQDIARLFSVLPDDTVEDFRKRTVLELLSSATSRASDAEKQLDILTREVIPAGENLGRVLAQDFGQTPEESIARLTTILGEDGFEVVRQLATVEAAKLRSDQAGRAVGGLVGGSILSNLLRFELKAGVDIARFRIIAGLLGNRVTSAWLASSLKIPERGAAMRSFQVVLPQILDVASQELGEGSERFARVKKFFEQEVPKTLGVK